MKILLHAPRLNISIFNIARWLRYYYKLNFVYNDCDSISDLSIRINNLSSNIDLKYKNIEYFDNANKLLFNHQGTYSFSEDFTKYFIDKQYNKILDTELNALLRFIYFFESKKSILSDYPGSDNLRKLVDLEMAKRVGLPIPSTIVSSNKKELLLFLKSHESITKVISNTFHFVNGEEISGYQGTKVIKAKDISKLEKITFPILLQELLSKEFEIRVLFLNGIFYTMAILDPIKHIDVRTNFTLDKPRWRLIPFKLPGVILKKVKLLFSKLKLKAGSIDMIYTTNNQYYFIELNPCGQFDWLSYPCNYQVEKFIADTIFINYEKATKEN